MVKIEQIAQAALRGDSLETRSLVQDFLRQNPDLSVVSKPDVNNVQILVASAAILELLALRSNQKSPSWTLRVGALREPIFLVKYAERMTHLRALCVAESPEPLRKRGLLAPPEYLAFA